MRRARTLTFSTTWLLLTMAMPVHSEVIYGITAASQGNQVFTFDSATPSTLLALHEVTGFVGNPSNDEAITSGFDIRPADGKLYGVSQNARIYTVDPATGIVNLASTLHSSSPLPQFLNLRDIDFDPVADRLRVIMSDFPPRNFQVDVDTGEAIEQARLNRTPDDPQSGGAVWLCLEWLIATILLMRQLRHCMRAHQEQHQLAQMRSMPSTPAAGPFIQWDL
jgi:hypothetical protein